jgi:cyclic-di-GMP phosphodiesterase TipF (flagellum assembly factor)
MNVISDIIITLGNLLISVFVTMMLPSFIPGIDPNTAMLTGVVIFLIGVQLHSFYVSKANKDDTTNRLMSLHQDYQVYLDKIELLTEETCQLKEQLNSGDHGANKEIVNEMKLLQTLLGQVVDKSGKSLSSNLENNKDAPSMEITHGNEHEAEEILNIMHHALEDNRIDLYLQPIVSLPSRKISHYEAYSRVRNDSGEVIFPTQYLKVAEDSGLVSTLDNLLLFRCIQVIRRLGPRRPDMRFFCNISSVSLNDKDFFPQFVDFMLDNQELSDRLVFEFTQQDVERHPNEVWNSLAKLGKRGFRFSMDNVVTLNHDLSDLASRYFRYVKINPKLFLNDKIDIDRADVNESYQRFDIEVIIEKIETDSTLVEILDCGITQGQGYLFGEPVLSSDIMNNL